MFIFVILKIFILYTLKPYLWKGVVQQAHTFSNAYIKFGLDRFFKQDKFFSAYGTETATPAYTLLSAGIGTNIKAFNRSDFMSLYISGENLADIAYQNHLSRLKYASENPVTGRMEVFNMGRNVSVKLIMNF